MARKTRMKMPTPVRLPSGNWRCQVMVDGRKYSVTAPSEREAATKAMGLKYGLIKEKQKPAEMTLRAACEEYISRREGRRSPTTIAGYRKIIRTDFQSILDMPLKKLTPRILDDAVKEMCERPAVGGGHLSEKTIKNNWMFIAGVLDEYAPDLDHRVILPEVKNHVTVIQDEEAIIRAVVGTEVELPCLLAAWLSLTMSEIKGLTKSKSIQGDYLIVRETVVMADGKEIRKSGPKEEKRARALRIPKHIRDLIDKVDGDIIVPATANSITKRYRRILEAAGVPYLNFHGLRHINSSVMGSLLVDPATAMARGGWKNDSVMYQVYTHSLSQKRTQADDKIDEYFESILGTEK